MAGAALIVGAGDAPGNAIAEAYWKLHCQKRGAWNWETDIRLWSERW